VNRRVYIGGNQAYTSIRRKRGCGLPAEPSAVKKKPLINVHTLVGRKRELNVSFCCWEEKVPFSPETEILLMRPRSV